MFPVSFGSICIVILLSAVSPHPTYLIPQQRSDAASINIVETIPSNSLEYQIVPSSEYAVATVQPSELSIIDYVLSPVTAIISLGSTAVSVVSWILINGSMVFLGMAIVIGFCALTPYCTLTIVKPSFLARANNGVSYLDQLEYFFNEAYNKYYEIQNTLL